MGFRKLILSGVAALSCVAHAQLGVYGMYEGTQVSNVSCLGVGVPCTSGGGSVNPFGGVGGVYYDFKSFGPVRFGADLRGELLHANKSAASPIGGDGSTRVHDALGGLRASFTTPINFLRPYAQVSAGWASSDVANLNIETYTNYVKYEVFAGADIRVFPILDVRPIELGFGGMSRVGNGSGNSSLTVKSIGAGVVFHLP
jgi:hypothetical protein